MIFPSPWMTFGPPATPFVQPVGGNWGNTQIGLSLIVTPVQAYKETIVETGQTDQQAKD
jgi:hypothetical protein